MIKKIVEFSGSICVMSSKRILLCFVSALLFPTLFIKFKQREGHRERETNNNNKYSKKNSTKNPKHFGRYNKYIQELKTQG